MMKSRICFTYKPLQWKSSKAWFSLFWRRQKKTTTDIFEFFADLITKSGALATMIFYLKFSGVVQQ